MAHISGTKTDLFHNFLASEIGLTTETIQIGEQPSGSTVSYIPAGTIVPANDDTAKGILFENVDVRMGAHAGAAIVAGRIFESRLPEAPAAAAKTALEKSGIVFVEPPECERV